MNKGINLAVDKGRVKSVPLIKDRSKLLRISSMAMMFVVGASSIVIYILVVFSPLPQLRSDEQQLKNELSVFQTDIYKLAFINERGDSIRKIIAQRPAYDKKLELIESKLPLDVQLDSLTIDKKIYALEFSSKNLDSLDYLLNSLVDSTGKDKEFLRIYLSNISMDEDSQKFILVVNLLTI